MRDDCSHDLLNAGWNTFWQHYEKKSKTRNFAEKAKIPAVDTKCQSNDQQLARFCNACVLHLLVDQERYFVAAAQKSTILHALASTNVVCDNKRQSWGVFPGNAGIRGAHDYSSERSANIQCSLPNELQRLVHICYAKWCEKTSYLYTIKTLINKSDRFHDKTTRSSRKSLDPFTHTRQVFTFFAANCRAI